MRLVTANVLHTLPDRKAADALTIILGKHPQIVALQEWPAHRRDVLAEAGTFTRFPGIKRRLNPPRTGYAFAAPITGGLPLGVDASWGEIVYARHHVIAPRGKADRATSASEYVVQEHATGQTWPVLNTHLLAHHDDPAHLRGWNQGREWCERWATRWIRDGYSPWVLGDVNKHLLDMPPLVSCWHKHQAQWTFRGKTHRTIDAIYGTQTADDVRAFDVGSDHRAVVADYFTNTKEKR